MNTILNAAMYSSIINHNTSAVIGLSVMKDLQNNKSEKINDKYEKPNNIYKPRVKHTRTYIIPEDNFRCAAFTQKGERCMCRKLKESDYCVTHNKQFNPKPITKNQEEKIEKQIGRTWKNLYGLIN